MLFYTSLTQCLQIIRLPPAYVRPQLFPLTRRPRTNPHPLPATRTNDARIAAALVAGGTGGGAADVLAIIGGWEGGGGGGWDDGAERSGRGGMRCGVQGRFASRFLALSFPDVSDSLCSSRSSTSDRCAIAGEDRPRWSQRQSVSSSPIRVRLLPACSVSILYSTLQPFLLPISRSSFLSHLQDILKRRSGFGVCQLAAAARACSSC